MAPQLRVISGGSQVGEVADEDLVRSFVDGEAAALGQLIARHQDAVFRVARRFTRSAEEARDLSQRVFLRSIEAGVDTLARLERDQVPFRAWILRVALNLGFNHVRDSKASRTANVESLSLVSAAPGPQQSLERAEEEALTRRAVLELPGRQREVFLLRIDAGLPFAQVAQTLGITESNAKSHFHHAVQRLKAEVAKAGQP
ncbi:MAG: sigma-70 family RNA polymerase sigma factor [Myxococcaceae bacterium]